VGKWGQSPYIVPQENRGYVTIFHFPQDSRALPEPAQAKAGETFYKTAPGGTIFIFFTSSFILTRTTFVFNLFA
jgi:hypothetical protein